MAISATATLNVSALGKAIERKSARAIGRAADNMGAKMVEIMQEMIDSELGPSSGRSADRGMVPMRDLDWQYEVDNPGSLPITVTIFCPDLSGDTLKKFCALNYGHGPYIQTGKFSFTGAKANREGAIVRKMVKQKAMAGKQWLQRCADSAGAAFRARRFFA